MIIIIFVQNISSVKPGEIEQFEVFVMPRMENNLTMVQDKIVDLDNIKSLIVQLLQGLGQLTAKQMTHNDLKPANILINEIDNSPRMTSNMTEDYEIKIGDFGQAGKLGGTPGWTAPQFRSERVPGEADMYSVGMLMLYLLVDETDLFYCLRDNFVSDYDVNQPWMARFRNQPEIKFVMKMMDLVNQPTVADVEREWTKIEHSVDMISRARLTAWIGVPACLLKLEFKQDWNASTITNVDIFEA